MPDERPEDYEAMLARIAASANPEDAIEEIFVNDFAELTFEINRMRDMKTRIIASAKFEAVEKLLEPSVGPEEARRLARAWSLDAQSVASNLLREMGLSSADVTAKAFELRLAECEKVNGMIMQAEARRNSALREMERYRQALALRLREAAAIEDAEFEEVMPAIGA